MICNNIQSVHSNQIINETPDGIRVICTKCKQINVIRIGADGRMNNRLYSKVFKSDILQPGENLYYREHPEIMSII